MLAKQISSTLSYSSLSATARADNLNPNFDIKADIVEDGYNTCLIWWIQMMYEKLINDPLPLSSYTSL